MGTQATLGDTGVALVGGDPCALVEGVPTSGDPLRKSPRSEGRVRGAGAGGGGGQGAGARSRQAAAALAGLLGEAETVFRVARGADGASKPYNDARRSKARAWLERWVIRPGAPLRVGEFGFEPAPGLRAALMLAACRGGDREAAIAYGRRARGDDEGHARAFAALLLLAGGARRRGARAARHARGPWVLGGVRRRVLGHRRGRGAATRGDGTSAGHDAGAGGRGASAGGAARRGAAVRAVDDDAADVEGGECALSGGGRAVRAAISVRELRPRGARAARVLARLPEPDLDRRGTSGRA
jgi:hypothetical protein